ARDEDVAPFPHVHGEVRHGWGRGAVTLLGDAAPSFPPPTGQGANQALEDASALTLASSGKSAANGPEAALRRDAPARYRRGAPARPCGGAGGGAVPRRRGAPPARGPRRARPRPVLRRRARGAPGRRRVAPPGAARRPPGPGARPRLLGRVGRSARDGRPGR